MYEPVSVFSVFMTFGDVQEFFKRKIRISQLFLPLEKYFLKKNQNMQKIRILSFDAKRYRQPAESNPRPLEHSNLRLTDMPLSHAGSLLRNFFSSFLRRAWHHDKFYRFAKNCSIAEKKLSLITTSLCGAVVKVTDKKRKVMGSNPVIRICFLPL